MTHDNHDSGRRFVHWLTYDIPANVTEMRASDPGQGTTLFGATSLGAGRAFFNGPCPQSEDVVRLRVG